MEQKLGVPINFRGPCSKSVLVIFAVVISVSLIFCTLWAWLPVATPRGAYSRVLLDRNLRLLGAEVSKDDEQWRFAPVSRIPPKYLEALLVFEDKRFFTHWGIDVLSVMRAIKTNLSAGRVVSGASTLSMQVARMAHRQAPRTLTQKLWEALLALKLESSLSKQDILVKYVSHAPFGGNVVGLSAAAWRYYNRPPKELTWAEAATLAVLPNSPSLIHPGRGRQKLLSKRNRLLKKLYTLGKLTRDDLRISILEPLPKRPSPIPRLSPHFLHSFVPKEKTYISSIDVHLQKQLSKKITYARTDLKNLGVHNVSAIIIHVPSAEVRAYIGNGARPDAEEHSPYVDVNLAPRSTGSLLKPFLYGLALQSGDLLPSELLSDIPIRIGGFRPLNFDRDFSGAVPADLALARSLNVPATLLLKRYGPTRFISEIKTMGLNHINRAPSHYGLSFILGGAEATPLELAALYTKLAYTALDSKTLWPGLSLGSSARLSTAPLLMSDGAAYLTLNALYNVQRPGAHTSWKRLGSSQYIAWKTGTSFGFRDAWAIGATPEYVVSVWTGNADGEGRPNLTGMTAAAPILFSIFDALPTGAPFQAPKSSLELVEVCAHSGLRATIQCTHRKQQLSLKDVSSSSTCPYCQQITTTKDGQFRVQASCTSLEDLHHKKVFVLPPRQEFFYRKHHPTYQGMPQYKKGCESDFTTEQNLAILFPKEKSEVYIPIDFSGEPSKIVAKATHRDPKARLFWYLDKSYLGETQNFHELELSPKPGVHLLTVLDTTGEVRTRNFQVLETPKL